MPRSQPPRLAISTGKHTGPCEPTQNCPIHPNGSPRLQERKTQGVTTLLAYSDTCPEVREVPKEGWHHPPLLSLWVLQDPSLP